MGLAVTQIAVDQHGRVFAIDTSGAIWAMHMSTGSAWTKIEGPAEPPPPEADTEVAGTETVGAEDEHETKKSKTKKW